MVEERGEKDENICWAAGLFNLAVQFKIISRKGRALLNGISA